MRRILAVVPLLLCACTAVRPASQAAASPKRTEVKLDLRIALPIVPISLDGQPAQRFIFDTGAALTTVACRGRAPGPLRLSTLAFGELRFHDVPAQCTEIPDIGAEGILSPQSAFEGALLELDGRSFAVRLYRDLDEAGWRALVGETVHSAPLTWTEGVATVEVHLAGKTWTMRLDSGAGGCGLSRADLDRLGGAGRDELTLPLAVGDSRPGKEQLFVLDGPSLGFPWFTGRRTAITADRKSLLFTDR
ncbi:MAG: hypothetical protein QM765_31230 [Myxococcales bacterium]